MKSDVAQDDPAVCTRNVVEAELVEQAQARLEAFGPLYELYYGKILGYIYRRTTLRRRESNRRWQAELDRVWFDSPHPDAEEDVEEKMRAFAHLHAAVEGLPEKYRVAISLRYFEAMPYADIAEVLGTRLGTVKSLIHRGLKRLKRQCQHELQEEGHLP